MSRYSGFFFLRQSLNGLVKNSVQSVTSIFVLTIGMVFASCFLLIMQTININIDQVGALNEVVVFLDDNLTDDESVAVYKQIAELPNVSYAKRITGKDGLEAMKAEFDEEYRSLLDLVKDENFLPDSVRIEYSDIKKVDTLIYQLNNIQGVSKVKSWQDTAKTLVRIKNAISIGFVWVMVFVIGFSITLIINTIKLSVHTRRGEINLMRYIGATNGFIVAPFVLEGVIIGTVSSLIAYAVQWYIFNYIIVRITSGVDLIKIFEFSDISSLLMIGYIGSGVFLGVVSSVMSTRKYLKV